jgi:hypothetical protein
VNVLVIPERVRNFNDKRFVPFAFKNSAADSLAQKRTTHRIEEFFTRRRQELVVDEL